MNPLPESLPKKPLIRPARGFDAVSFLTLYLFFACAIPSKLVIPSLGSVGRPAILWGLIGMAWWAYYRLQLPSALRYSSRSVKFTMVAFLCAVAMSYAIANLKGMPSSDSTTANSALLRIVSWAGVALVASDGINSQERLNVLLRRITLTGGLMSLLGLAQFLTGQSLIDWIALPGFVESTEISSIQDRSGFTRAAGTAVHPLEYGSVLCITLPLVLALAAKDIKRPTWLRWFPVLTVPMAMLLSVSRSALIGGLVGLLILAPSLPAKFRLRAALLAVAVLVGVMFLIPGMLGTLKGLFVGISEDPSTQSRTSSINSAVDIAIRQPFFGRGFGTFLPRELILDNQYLLLLIEVGLIGTFAFLLLNLMAIATALRVRNLATDALWKLAAPAAGAGVAAGAVLLAFFDGLSFPMTGAMLFLLIGVCAAMHRISTQKLKIEI